jgi:hypothetical protein
MNTESDETISHVQQKHLLETFSYVHKVISRKLGRKYQNALEDIKQRVFLKLWHWKRERSERNLSAEEWHKLAHVVANHEVIDFFRKKDNRHIPFSQMGEEIQKEVLSIESPDTLIGNSLAEIHSMLALVWIAAQNLTVRQKYAYFLQFRDFIIEFMTAGCCSIEELAEYFEVSRAELAEIINNLPLSDEQMARRLEIKFSAGDGQIQPKQIWEARSKAKAKLARSLKDFFENERLFVQRRS